MDLIKKVRVILRRFLKRIKKILYKNRVSRALLRPLRYIKKKVKRIYINHVTERIMNETEIEPNKIAIMTNTYRYSCNPKYIYEELIRQRLNYKIVWITNNKKARKLGYPDNVRAVSMNSKKGLREIYSAKIWLDNGIAFSNYFDKREGQIHLQTMHGSLGIKRLDNAVLCRNERGPSGQRVVYRESNETDYVITNSQFEEDVFRTVFWKNTPMMRLGHARTDILFEKDPYRAEAIREKLFEKYEIPLEKKLVLYAPTHRKGLTIEDLSINYQELVSTLEEKFGGKFAVMVRMHKRTKNIAFENESGDSTENQILYDVTNYPDIQELMLVTEIGITDYSSWIYDYVLARRPGFIFATDLERYNTNTGLYYPLEETPFPVCKSSKELIEKVKQFNNELYLERVEEFLDGKQSVDDGCSAKRIVEWIRTLAPIED